MSSPLSRFLRTFYDRFFTTLREDAFNKYVLFSQVAYFLVSKLAFERWEVIVPLVWGICAMLGYHALKSAHIVSREIATEIHEQPAQVESPFIYAPSGEYASISVSVPAAPRWYRVRLYGAACTVLCLCVFASAWAWERSRKTISHEVVKPDASPPAKPNEVPPNPSLEPKKETLKTKGPTAKTSLSIEQPPDLLPYVSDAVLMSKARDAGQRLNKQWQDFDNEDIRLLDSFTVVQNADLISQRRKELRARVAPASYAPFREGVAILQELKKRHLEGSPEASQLRTAMTRFADFDDAMLTLH